MYLVFYAYIGTDLFTGTIFVNIKAYDSIFRPNFVFLWNIPLISEPVLETLSTPYFSQRKRAYGFCTDSMVDGNLRWTRNLIESIESGLKTASV